jgi:hypothetical protein
MMYLVGATLFFCGSLYSMEECPVLEVKRIPASYANSTLYISKTEFDKAFGKQLNVKISDNTASDFTAPDCNVLISMFNCKERKNVHDLMTVTQTTLFAEAVARFCHADCSFDPRCHFGPCTSDKVNVRRDEYFKMIEILLRFGTDPNYCWEKPVLDECNELDEEVMNEAPKKFHFKNNQLIAAHPSTLVNIINEGQCSRRYELILLLMRYGLLVNNKVLSWISKHCADKLSELELALSLGDVKKFYEETRFKVNF